MENILISIGALVAILVIVYVVTWLGGRVSQGASATRASGSKPAGSSQVGAATGLLGGTIPDAAVADYAMKRVAQTTGQPPTAADAARAAAMVQGMKPPGDQGN